VKAKKRQHEKREGMVKSLEIVERSMAKAGRLAQKKTES